MTERKVGEARVTDEQARELIRNIDTMASVRGMDGAPRGLSRDEDETRALAADLLDARAEVEKLKGVLLSRHGGEPLSLLAELDQAKADLARLAGIVERVKAVPRYERVSHGQYETYETMDRDDEYGDWVLKSDLDAALAGPK